LGRGGERVNLHWGGTGKKKKKATVKKKVSKVRLCRVQKKEQHIKKGENRRERLGAKTVV